MGKRGGWFSAVKKAFAPESKEKKDQVGLGSNFYKFFFFSVFCFSRS